MSYFDPLFTGMPLEVGGGSGSAPISVVAVHGNVKAPLSESLQDQFKGFSYGGTGGSVRDHIGSRSRSGSARSMTMSRSGSAEEPLDVLATRRYATTGDHGGRSAGRADAIFDVFDSINGVLLEVDDEAGL